VIREMWEGRGYCFAVCFVKLFLLSLFTCYQFLGLRFKGH
jgi:hypothetical protein